MVCSAAKLVNGIRCSVLAVKLCCLAVLIVLTLSSSANKRTSEDVAFLLTRMALGLRLDYEARTTRERREMNMRA